MRRFLSLGVVVSIGLAAAAAVAAPAAPPSSRAAAPASVPEALRPWIPWAMYAHEEEVCPDLETDHVCAWGGRLELALTGGGGRFSQSWELFADGPIPFSGGASQWPLDVKVDGKPVVAINVEEDDDGAP